MLDILRSVTLIMAAGTYVRELQDSGAKSGKGFMILSFRFCYPRPTSTIILSI
jgi:hypothetical protein